MMNGRNRNVLWKEGVADFRENNFETLCTINSEFLGQRVNFNFLRNVMYLLAESVLRSSRRCVSQEILFLLRKPKVNFHIKGIWRLTHHGPV